MFENFWRGGFVEYFYHVKVLINLKIHTIHHWKQMRKIVVNKLESCNAQTINTLTLYITLASLVWLFSTARFQMFPQSASMDWYKVTLVALVLLLSTVRFQMSPQISCKRRCKVTLVAFIWFFSAVNFHMCPQMACLRRGIITLVALVWLFSTVCFQMIPQNVGIRGCIITLVAFVRLFCCCDAIIFIWVIVFNVLIHHLKDCEVNAVRMGKEWMFNLTQQKSLLY